VSTISCSSWSLRLEKEGGRNCGNYLFLSGSERGDRVSARLHLRAAQPANLWHKRGTHKETMELSASPRIKKKGGIAILETQLTQTADRSPNDEQMKRGKKKGQAAVDRMVSFHSDNQEGRKRGERREGC